MTPMQLGFLLPRYGARVLGGAEIAARAYAEQLAARGVACEVFTTCALDAATWRDEVPLGTTTEDGVVVHRFRSRHGRRADFGARNAAVLAGDPFDRDAARQWLEALGPVCPDAVDAAVASDCDLVTVHPYLYHPCVAAVGALQGRAVLHPATHDEPAIHLPLYGPMFEAAGALAFWSEEEQATTQRLFPATTTSPQLVAGIGIDLPRQSQPLTALPPRVGDRRYVLCLGKVLRAKGCHVLATAFRAYRERRPDADVALVFAGTVVDPIDTGGGRDDVLVLGEVDETTKAALLEHCELLVHASPYESLSLVLLEAWAHARPALVNGACDVTRGQCERHGGGLWFVDYATFEAGLDHLLTDRELNEKMGDAGKQAVESHYTWPTVVDRYLAFLTSLVPAR
jgi:glycosyltransferase involved in cell wall biosynthesis